MTEVCSELTEGNTDEVGREVRYAKAEFARLDLGIMGLPIFRALPRRGREKARRRMFEVDTVHDGRKLRVVGAYTLGADDLSVLLAVLGLVGLEGKSIMAKHSQAARVDIVDGLESEGEVINSLHMRLRTTLYALCREAGIRASGDAYGRVSESLRRLRAVHYDDMGPVGSNSRRLYASGKQNLLAVTTREDTKEVEVVINARFASFVLGDQWGNVDLRESRRLGETARILHQRLSVMLRSGSTMRISIDRMVEWAYGDEKMTASTLRDRRHEIRRSLREEINILKGWSISEPKNGSVVTITRSAGDEQQAAR